MTKSRVKCLVQPGDGLQPLVRAIDGARRSVEILIFRFDRPEIERALENAVIRGVQVHALTAFTNRGGEKGLRQLEMRLLAAGVAVARTADDLVRYHGKMMLIDRKELHLLAFNFTRIDTERSRSFGIITRERQLVAEAAKLFDADTQRQPYSPGSPVFVVSPVNARKNLGAFIKGAKKELLIYDPEVSDPEMVKHLGLRAKAGVTVRIIGKLAENSHGLTAHKLAQMRLHTRTIIRDGAQAFLGSQSLRSLELDSRREIGIIVRDKAAVALMRKTFNSDWDLKDTVPAQPVDDADINDDHAKRVAKKVARAIAADMPSIIPMMESTVLEMGGKAAGLESNPEMEASVKSAVKDAVREVVRNFMEDAVEQLQADSK